MIHVDELIRFDDIVGYSITNNCTENQSAHEQNKPVSSSWCSGQSLNTADTKTLEKLNNPGIDNSATDNSSNSGVSKIDDEVDDDGKNSQGSRSGIDENKDNSQVEDKESNLSKNSSEHHKSYPYITLINGKTISPMEFDERRLVDLFNEYFLDSCSLDGFIKNQADTNLSLNLINTNAQIDAGHKLLRKRDEKAYNLREDVECAVTLTEEDVVKKAKSRVVEWIKM